MKKFFTDYFKDMIQGFLTAIYLFVLVFSSVGPLFGVAYIFDQLEPWLITNELSKFWGILVLPVGLISSTIIPYIILELVEIDF